MPYDKKELKTAGEPHSCDTFVVLPPLTANGCIVFGKNSDRPAGEVQEIVYVPEQNHPPGTKLQCTYIEIDEVIHTHAVILSKPAWMWGAEMGANQHGVCIGNEAVWTHLNGPSDEDERLLGMDLLRLGLERGSTAREAVDVITTLLKQHGQGGPCSDIMTDMTYHNSFIVADRAEAWVLETAGDVWAAERVTSGCRNISNTLTIGTKIDLMSEGLKEHAESNRFWDSSKGEFNFADAYGEPNGSAVHRQTRGNALLEKLGSSGNFSVMDMFTVLRDKESGICRAPDHQNPTASSQVSVLSPVGESRPCCHWFTGTPDPAMSVFKPFVFTPNVRVTPHVISPAPPPAEDPAKIKPRFQKDVDREHNLYKLHKAAVSKAGTPKGGELRQMIQDLETRCVNDVEAFLSQYSGDNVAELDDLFKDVVETEVKFYK